LTSLNYGGTGTIRENRIPADCPLKSTIEMQKKVRGKIDAAFDDNTKISLVR